MLFFIIHKKVHSISSGCHSAQSSILRFLFLRYVYAYIFSQCILVSKADFAQFPVSSYFLSTSEMFSNIPERCLIGVWKIFEAGKLYLSLWLKCVCVVYKIILKKTTTTMQESRTVIQRAETDSSCSPQNQRG